MFLNKFIISFAIIIATIGGAFAQNAKPDNPAMRYYIGARAQYSLASFSQDIRGYMEPGNVDKMYFSSVPQFGFDATAGWQFAPKWRAELNYGYAGRNVMGNKKYMSWQVQTQYLMANALFTAWQQDLFSVYVGGGLGAAFLGTRLSGTPFDFERDRARPAVQAIFGIQQEITKNIILDAQFRSLYNGGFSERIGPDTAKTNNMLTNSLMVGVRIGF